MADNPHRGHRQRLKARAQTQGFASLEPHEQIELLLCYAIPQGNVNPLAHRLLDRFGSLPGICQASRQELLEVAQVGEHTASLLRLIPELVRAYLVAEAAPVERYDTVDKIEDLLIRHYVGMTEESVSLLLFGGKLELLAFEELHRGSFNSVSVSLRAIIERAINRKAACVVLAHNHPGGLAIPSGDDLHTTHQLDSALTLAELPLLEHFIIAGSRATPLLRRENLHGRLAALESYDARRFYAPDTAEENA